MKYLHPEDLGDALEESYDGQFSENEISAVVDVLKERYGNDTFISPETVELSEYMGAIEVDIEEVEDTPIYVDLEGGENHVCVTHGNLGGEEDLPPPEGPTQNGDGEDIFGVR